MTLSLDDYSPALESLINRVSQYGIYTIEISTPNSFNGRYVIQTDDVDIEFSKTFTEYIKNIQHQNSQRANSIFTNDVFSLIYSYLSILELKEPQGDSPIQTSRHTTVRQEKNIFSKVLNATRENLTSNEITKHVNSLYCVFPCLLYYLLIVLHQGWLIDICLVVVKYYLLDMLFPLWEKLLH